MTTIATLAVKLIADASGFQTAMDQAERKTQTWSQSVSKNLKDVGGKITNFGKMATVGLTLPIIGAGIAAVNMASNMEETKSKVNVVFGEMSASVLAWSTDSATAMGISQEQALSAAATYGNLFTSLGLGQQPAAAMSTSLVQLASDLASFNNANPEEVLLALRSGLSGEIEPLKKYGVAMNEAILKNKAMEMGLGDNLQVLTEAQKLQLRYAIILEQTATAQGDFARTADGMANSTRTAKAQLADAAVVLGQQLLPYGLKLITWVSQAIAWFQQLTPEQQKWIVVILGVVAVAGPLLMIVGGLITALGAIIPVITAVVSALAPFALPILAIIAVLVLLYFAWTNNWGGIQEKTATAIAFVKGLIESGMQFIQDLTSGKLGALSQIWQQTTDAIKTVWTVLTTNIKLIFQAFSAAFHGDWYRFGELLRMAWDNAWNTIRLVLLTAWSNLKIIVSGMVTNIINFFKNTDWGAVGRGIVDGIARGLRLGATVVINAAMSAARAALQAVQGFLGIRSPSKVFEMQVGWQMAAGTAEGWKRGLDNMLQPSFGLLTPTTAAVTPNVAVPNAGRQGGASFGNDEVIALLEEIAENVRIDYDKLARKVQNNATVRSR